MSGLKVRQSLQNDVTFTSAANHLAAELSTTTDFVGAQNRKSNVGALATQPASGISKDGEMYLGYYKNWHDLEEPDKDKVIAERIHTGVTGYGKRGGGGGGGRGGKGRGRGGGRAGRGGRGQSRKVTAMSKKVKELKDGLVTMDARLILALKKRDPSDGEPDDEPLVNQAGGAFGGRNAKKGKKVTIPGG